MSWGAIQKRKCFSQLSFLIHVWTRGENESNSLSIKWRPLKLWAVSQHSLMGSIQRTRKKENIFASEIFFTGGLEKPSKLLKIVFQNYFWKLVLRRLPNKANLLENLSVRKVGTWDRRRREDEGIRRLAWNWRP